MIRAYDKKDLESIVTIGNKAWRKLYENMRQEVGEDIFRVINPNPARRKGLEIREQAEQHPEWIMICEEQGKTVGFLTYRVNNQIGEICNNAVDPDCGLKGIGQQMYKAVLDRFKQQGLKVAKVLTGLDEAHGPARRAYERAGFSVRRESATYYMALS